MFDTVHISETLDDAAPGFYTPSTYYTLAILYTLLLITSTITNTYSLLCSPHPKLNPTAPLYIRVLRVLDVLHGLLWYGQVVVSVWARGWVMGRGVCWVTGYLFPVPLFGIILNNLAITGTTWEP